MQLDYHQNQYGHRVIYDGAVHACSWSYWYVPGTLSYGDFD